MKLNLLIKKRLAIFAFLLGLCYSVHSQDQEGARVVTVSQASSSNTQFYVQVGLPYLGITTGTVHTTTPVDVRFPWHILYYMIRLLRNRFQFLKVILRIK